MKLLLDTHAFLYAAAAPESLGAKTKALLTDDDNERAVSGVTLWEVAIKTQLGKLAFFSEAWHYSHAIRAIGASYLPVEERHAMRLFDMPLKHRDPFDRLLIAQALEDGYTLVSKDRQFKQYGVPVIW